MFASNFQTSVRPVLEEVERLLDTSRRGVIELALRSTTSFIMQKPEKLRQSFQVLLDHGLSEGQARDQLLQHPQVFSLQLDGPAVSAKLRFYSDVLGISSYGMLLHHFAYLKEGLPKVAKRVGLQRGARMPVFWSRTHPLPDYAVGCIHRLE